MWRERATSRPIPIGSGEINLISIPPIADTRRHAR